MDQVGQSRSSLMKSRLRQRFVRPRHNAVACYARVQDHADVTFRHVATGTIVRRLLLLSHTQGQFAALVRVAAGALSGEVPGSFRAGRLHVRIVASSTAKPALTAPVTFTQNH